MKLLRRRVLSIIVLALLALPAGAQQSKQPALLVFAASSLTNVVGELSDSWTRNSGVRVRLSFASSSILARQIEAGGKAEVFISADQEWMDYLQARNLIQRPSRRNLVGNRLVLIAPVDSKLELRIAPGFPLA